MSYTITAKNCKRFFPLPRLEYSICGIPQHCIIFSRRCSTTFDEHWRSEFHLLEVFFFSVIERKIVLSLYNLDSNDGFHKFVLRNFDKVTISGCNTPIDQYICANPHKCTTVLYEYINIKWSICGISCNVFHKIPVPSYCHIPPEHRARKKLMNFDNVNIEASWIQAAVGYNLG